MRSKMAKRQEVFLKLWAGLRAPCTPWKTCPLLGGVECNLSCSFESANSSSLLTAHSIPDALSGSYTEFVPSLGQLYMGGFLKSCFTGEKTEAMPVPKVTRVGNSLAGG